MRERTGKYFFMINQEENRNGKILQRMLQGLTLQVLFLI